MHCEFNSQCERIDLWNQAVRFYNIEVSQEDWTFINDKNQFIDEPYVPCNFTMNYQQENEKLFEFAMVKVKGSQGGKVACEYGINSAVCRSPSYQINIDKNLPENFDKEEPKVGGKDKLQFHSMMNDESLMIERLSYSIMHHYLNISTARAVHCVLFVNGEKLGVFLNTEEIDEKSIGPIFFGEKGTIYKDAWPQDYGIYGLIDPTEEFEMDSMLKLLNESLQCVSEDQLEMNCSPQEGRMMLKKYIDTDSYVKVMLANNLLNNFDGTPKSLHNHYWFQNKNNDPYVFIPWDYNNLIMLKLCKVNADTGFIEGYGDIERNNSLYMSYFEPMFTGVCDSPPFQYLPSTIEERNLVCDCLPQLADIIPGFLNAHMTCKGAVSIVLSQSLIDDYFNYRDDVFKGNEINVQNEVKSMVEYWSNQIQTHITTSSLKYPMKDVWEKRIEETPLLFDYGLDQLMNRKKELNRTDIDAHFEWMKNRANKSGKCDGLQKKRCRTNFDCEYCKKGIKDMEGKSTICSPQDMKCYVISLTPEECGGNNGFLVLADGWNCFDETKFKICPRKEKSESPAESKGTEKSDVSTESPAESKGTEKDIFSESDVSTVESKGNGKSEASSAELKNVFSKTFGIAAILILLLFIL